MTKPVKVTEEMLAAARIAWNRTFWFSEEKDNLRAAIAAALDVYTKATPEVAEPAGTASEQSEEIARLKAQVEELQAEVDDLNVNDERDVWTDWGGSDPQDRSRVLGLRRLRRSGRHRPAGRGGRVLGRAECNRRARQQGP